MARGVRALRWRAAVLGGVLVAACVAGAWAPVRSESPAPTPQATSVPTALPAASPPTATPNLPQPIYPPSPCPSGASDCSPGPVPVSLPTVPPSPAPVIVEPTALRVLLGHQVSAHLLSPPSGIVFLSGFDENVVRAIFNPVDRTIDILGLHPGSTQVTIAGENELRAVLGVTVQVAAGKADATTAINITGHPASAEFVAEMAEQAALSVAYPLPGAIVNIGSPEDAGELAPDRRAIVHVPLDITGQNYFSYHQTVAVRITNLAQPQAAPRFMLVSDYPETITEEGTLFYSDVTFDKPARLLYYHYAPSGAPLRRVLVKVANTGDDSSVLELISGIAGPYTDILGVGHEATRRFLVHNAAGEGEVFEVPPRATINVIDQLLPANNLVCGLMQMRVMSGPGVRVAVVVQDAASVPTEPISETLLSSAVKHSRGIYQIPEFFYDESYVVGDAPTMLSIGKLPLPNLVQGEVLGGDYGVLQSADVNLLNPTGEAADVGLWFEPRGGRATGTLFINDDLVQLHPVDPMKDALVRRFTVPAHGFVHVSILTMPEGGSAYPVNLLFSSSPPPGAGWNVSSAVH